MEPTYSRPHMSIPFELPKVIYTPGPGFLPPPCPREYYHSHNVVFLDGHTAPLPIPIPRKKPFVVRPQRPPGEGTSFVRIPKHRFMPRDVETSFDNRKIHNINSLLKSLQAKASRARHLRHKRRHVHPTPTSSRPTPRDVDEEGPAPAPPVPPPTRPRSPTPPREATVMAPVVCPLPLDHPDSFLNIQSAFKVFQRLCRDIMQVCEVRPIKLGGLYKCAWQVRYMPSEIMRTMTKQTLETYMFVGAPQNSQLVHYHYQNGRLSMLTVHFAVMGCNCEDPGVDENFRAKYM